MSSVQTRMAWGEASKLEVQCTQTRETVDSSSVLRAGVKIQRPSCAHSFRLRDYLRNLDPDLNIIIRNRKQ